MQSVAFIQNKYYTDDGMEYVFARLRDELSGRSVALCMRDDLYASYPLASPDFSVAVFWDKDVALAKRLESVGVRLVNRASVVEICDDKEKTFAALSGKIELPETLLAPLVYDVSDGTDERFLDFAEKRIGYPVVVKQNTGSQGKQVYLAKNRAQLQALHSKLMHASHLLQRFVHGRAPGADTRVYIVGGNAVGAVERENTTDFRSNVALGGEMRRTELTPSLQAQAETAAHALGLEYGSVDFICENGRYVFIEANASAYMRGAESVGIPLAALYADYLAEVVHATAR